MHGTPNAVRRGKGDNPKSPQTLTNKQKRRSILITLTHKSHFDFRFVLAGVGRGGRNIMFGGASSLCPSDASGADHPADDDEVGEEGEVAVNVEPPDEGSPDDLKPSRAGGRKQLYLKKADFETYGYSYCNVSIQAMLTL